MDNKKNTSQEPSQAEKYYNEHKDDFKSPFERNKNEEPEKEPDFVPAPDKSQAENYYDENIEKLEGVYQIKKKKSSEPKQVTSNLDVQKFDENEFPAVREGDEQDQDLPHVEVEYDLTAEEVDSGMKLFQKKVIFKRNLFYTIAFSIVFVVYIVDLLYNGTRSTITYLGIAVCLGAIFIIWYNPMRYRRQMAKAMSLIEDKFSMNIYEEYIYIKEQNGGFRISYSDEKAYVMEQTDKYIICFGKERIYIVPKRCLKAGQEAEIRNYFKNLNERFYSMNN